MDFSVTAGSLRQHGQQLPELPEPGELLIKSWHSILRCQIVWFRVASLRNGGLHTQIANRDDFPPQPARARPDQRFPDIYCPAHR